ncbi:MAG TPA: GTPase RsgA, partial [Dehalococcoidia bacterium]
MTTGTVVEVHGVLSTVAVGNRRYHAHLPRGVRSPDPEVRSPVVVGDRVEVEVLNQEQVRILRVEPRRTTLTRTDGFDPRKRHALAANLDQVLLVVTPDQPPFRPRLIDRYLAAAAWDGLPAVICLNKIDLGVPEEVAWYLAGYRRIGYAVLQCSARTGEGMD